MSEYTDYDREAARSSARSANESATSAARWQERAERAERANATLRADLQRAQARIAVLDERVLGWTRGCQEREAALIATEVERDKQRERADRTAKVLAFVEWTPILADEKVQRCPCCERFKIIGHREHCMLKVALRGDERTGTSLPNSEPIRHDEEG